MHVLSWRSGLRTLGVVLLTIMAMTIAGDAAAQTYAIGNRVWFDTDDNGKINGAESGIDGVDVALYQASDLTAAITTQTTTDGGYYLFNNLAAGDYVVVITQSNFSGVLSGYWSSATGRLADGTISEDVAPLANSDIDSDDNGTADGSGPLGGTVHSSTITVGPGTSSEPLNEQDLDNGRTGAPDGQSNMTVDFGFYTTRIGDLVWDDADNDGHVNAETGFDNVTVQLISGDGSTLLDTVLTSGGGLYAFANQPAGEYIVRLPAIDFNPGGVLRDYGSSTGPLPATPYEPAPDPDVDLTDSDDNGTETNGLLGLGGYIQTTPITVTPGGEQSVDAAGGTTEFRVDFGINNQQQIDLVVTKTDGQSTYTPGETLHYVITVTNNGPADANGVTVNDARPAQVVSWTWTCAPGTPAAYNCTDDASNPANFVDTVDLPATQSITYDVTAQVSATPSGDLSNQVYAVPPPDMSDMTNGDNVATDVDALNAVDLAVTKDDGQTMYQPGATLDYTIVVTNNGPAAANGMSITDARPPQIETWSWTCDPSTPPAYQCTSDAGNPATFTDSLDLPAAATVTYHVTAQVATTVSGDLTNSVQVASPDATPELDPSNNTAADVDTLDAVDLVVTKTDGQTSYQSGTTVQYTIVITNNGPSAANGVNVSDARPSQITSWTWTCDPSTPPAYQCTSDASNPATFADSLDLPASASVTYTVSAQIGDAVSGDLVNSVTATASAKPDLNSADNTATDTDVLTPTTLSITKTVEPALARPGDTLTYTIQVTNTGTVTATSITVTDPLPAGLTYDSASGAGWTCSYASDTVTCTLPSLAASTAASPITIRAFVPADSTGVTPNTATVSAANAAATTGTAQAGVLAPIPTLSEVALAALAMMLAAIGVFVRR